MRRSALIGLAFALAAPALAAPAPLDSWGKPNVSLATYRAESIGCAMRAYYTDVADTDAAKAFVEGSRQLETLSYNMGGDILSSATAYARIEHSVNPEDKLKQIKAFQGSLLDKCLIEHGYHRFKLTDAQRNHLQRLKIGSDARHTYLHRLASDPAILTAQAEADEPPAHP